MLGSRIGVLGSASGLEFGFRVSGSGFGNMDWDERFASGG